jgi:hypothetical protein
MHGESSIKIKKILNVEGGSLWKELRVKVLSQ